MHVDRCAVLIPGANFGPHAPLLFFSGFAARARGAEPVAINWDPPADRFKDTEWTHRWVREQVEPVLDDIEAVSPPLLVGKSLGTFAASLAAERGLPAVWHTPLITREPVAEAIRRATAPCLLIGGTADPSWDGKLARQLSSHVLEVEGANHGMFITDAPLAESAAVMGRVATAVEKFLDDAVWG
ncbi:MAG: alpha/beta hydrolase [Stackebrandtia sp.]